MESIDAFIDRLPKAELHLHLVGSASVPTVLELRRRHPDGAGVPSSAAELAAFYEFRDFPHFSQVYGAVSSLVREPADVAELVLGAARDLAGQNVRYAELTVTPYTFTSAGMPVADLTEALNSDDPPMFGTTLTDEYRRAASVLGLSRAQLAGLAANGVRASFLDAAAKQALLAEIDAVAAGTFMIVDSYPPESAGSGPR
ncbi:MAG TPA: hypothetical protein VFX25_32845 [Streptosporangiaceae bacterium]|nr:hypothetical protein [Streptosporangiaceae bacterium]